jgi:hypothetical protein
MRKNEHPAQAPSFPQLRRTLEKCEWLGRRKIAEEETDASAARAPSTTLRAVPLPRKEAGEDLWVFSFRVAGILVLYRNDIGAEKECQVGWEKISASVDAVSVIERGRGWVRDLAPSPGCAGSTAVGTMGLCWGEAFDISPNIWVIRYKQTNGNQFRSKY